MKPTVCRLLPVALLLLAGSLPGQERASRYALFLAEEGAPKGESPARAASAAQQAVRRHLVERGVTVTGSVSLGIHAVFVQAPADQEASLRSLPSVVRVQRMREGRRHLTPALTLMNVPSAWTRLGGQTQAGRGVRIGLLDTGIDVNHPSLRAPDLAPPSGFPRCQGGDCDFTSGKVIVARSYVNRLVLGDDPAVSRPDDLSPRDRVGHGTAAAIAAAGVESAGPLGTVVGVAPGAYLGNYKVFGSPGVNDTTFEDVVIQALTDAYQDGMDIASVSLGFPALFGPLERCGQGGSLPCDPLAELVDRLSQGDSSRPEGMLVIASAGNRGDLGMRVPTFGTIDSPGTAPSALTVGATTNSVAFSYRLRVSGDDVPSSLSNVVGLFGNGPRPAGPLTAPLRDVARLGNDGRACVPLPSGSLAGAIALVQRGDCPRDVKVNNAQQAGAVGVVLFQSEGQEFLFPPLDLGETGIPTLFIGNAAGQALQRFLADRPERPVTLDSTPVSMGATADEVTYFSSYGPSYGADAARLAIKPEVVAPGTDLYVGTQRFDPNGSLFSSTGYTAVQGTSIAAALAAGVAALARQRHPTLRSQGLKSALVNTANPAVNEVGANGQRAQASVVAVGAGRLDADQAVRTTLAAQPAVLNFGVLLAGQALPSLTMQITNLDSQAATLTLGVEPRGAAPSATVTLSSRSLAIPPGGSATVSVRLEGSRPRPGTYEGVVTVSGGAVPLRVPYLYLVGDGVPADAYALTGDGFVGIPRANVPGRFLTVKVVDQFGVPVPNLAVRFRVDRGGGAIQEPDPRTDAIGIAAARAVLGSGIGEQVFVAEVGGFNIAFSGRTKTAPAINAGGVVDAASQRAERAYAPGSILSLYGRGFSEAVRSVGSFPIPLSLVGTSVSFDAPAQGVSVPGRLFYVSEGLINVQIPWEVRGLSSVQLKVSTGAFSSPLVTIPIAEAAPALFEYTEAASGRLLAAAQDEAARTLGTGNPALRGRVIVLYGNGLGPVTNPPPTGEPARVDPLSRTTLPVTVTIGGRPAQVLDSLLTPTLSGVYQVNVLVPADAPTGLQPLAVTVGGVEAKLVTVPVQ